MFVLKSLEDPLRRMPLFTRCFLIRFENLSDDRQKSLDLGLSPRLLLLIAGRLFVLQDLDKRVPTDVKPITGTTFTQAFNKDLTSDFRPKLHINVQSATPND